VNVCAMFFCGRIATTCHHHSGGSVGGVDEKGVFTSLCLPVFILVNLCSLIVICYIIVRNCISLSQLVHHQFVSVEARAVLLVFATNIVPRATKTNKHPRSVGAHFLL